MRKLIKIVDVYNNVMYYAIIYIEHETVPYKYVPDGLHITVGQCNDKYFKLIYFI